MRDLGNDTIKNAHRLCLGSAMYLPWRSLLIFLERLTYVVTSCNLTPNPLNIRWYIFLLSGFLSSSLHLLDGSFALGSNKRPRPLFWTLGNISFTITATQSSLHSRLGNALIIEDGNWMDVIPRFFSSIPLARPKLGPTRRTCIASEFLLKGPKKPSG